MTLRQSTTAKLARGLRFNMTASRIATVAMSTGAVAYSGAAYAAMAPKGPTWEMIAVGAISMVIMLIAAYAKGVSNRVDKLDEKYTALNHNVLREYHTKQDLNEILGEIKSSVKALHQRFDKMESLYGR